MISVHYLVSCYSTFIQLLRLFLNICISLISSWKCNFPDVLCKNLNFGLNKSKFNKLLYFQVRQNFLKVIAIIFYLPSPFLLPSLPPPHPPPSAHAQCLSCRLTGKNIITLQCYFYKNCITLQPESEAN